MAGIAMEQSIMELVADSGNARSMAMEAIQAASEGEFRKAEHQIAKARQEISRAHEFQTELIAKAAGGEPVEMNLIMIHGQDHLMSTLVVIDLAAEMVEMYRRI